MAPGHIRKRGWALRLKGALKPYRKKLRFLGFLKGFLRNLEVPIGVKTGFMDEIEKEMEKFNDEKWIF